jgi:hypothetical protein
MFAARRALTGAVQSRAFSASARDVRSPAELDDVDTRGRSFNWKRRNRIYLFMDLDIEKETIADDMLS